MPGRAIEHDDLLRLTHVTAGRLAPDGEGLAYTVSRIDAEAELERAELWIGTVEGSAHPVTGAGRSDARPAWSPDGASVAYLSTPDDGVPQLRILPAAGGDPRQLTDFARGITGGIAWSPDGTRIAFTSVPDEPARDPSRTYRVDRLVYRGDGIGLIDDAVRSLYVVDVATGVVSRLTHDRCMHDDPRWSPDGAALLVMASFDPDDAAYAPWPRMVDVASGAIREPTRAWAAARGAAWLPDGGGLVVVGRSRPAPYGAKDDLWVVRFDEAPENRTVGLDVGVAGILLQDMPVGLRSMTPLLDPRGGGAYVRLQRGGRAGIARVALEGDEDVRVVVDGDRACELLDVGRERLLFLTCDILNPADLSVSDLDGGGERRLTTLNDDWWGGMRLPTVERIVARSPDDVVVEAWYVAPPGGSGPRPTALSIHGGPFAAFGHVFRFETLLLASRGYGVLLPNYRGSSGYGDAFSTAIQGRVSDLEHADLMAAVDHVVERGWADPDRLGVFGASYGGMMTCWIVGHTDRFRAAVSQSPVINRDSYYGTADIGTTYTVEQIGATPWEAPEEYRRSSPLSYAHLVTTPTLLIQNEQDWRCPPEQAEQFYARLKVVGCETEMVRIPDASHSGTISGPVPGRVARNEALLDWLDVHLHP
jgi:dipeptidyl aminopeptidase/acylaminoacyl peptidase